ncbi:oligosaccharide flippase family protein [Muricauda sp. JGD-17]|uniref:Oligosaccharide flippase family protein n=1 Tax=Flagellimonas ochracea TaxID=2696472 RepID=A0A964TCG6_9FLAO|nr:oligosaccharide flippase family protein [Allomuricauda ochracea]NAY91641.1 oligosaccharide flippase family protein [Allomuricauda ochracea]
MLGAKKNLAKNSLIYAIFTILQKGFAFFLIPLYTTQLSTEEYGMLGIIMAAIPFFVLLAGLSIRGSTAYYYYEYKDKDPAYLRTLWGTSFTFILVSSGILIILLWASKAFLMQHIFPNVAFFPYMFLALISVFTQPAYFYYQSILKAKQQAKAAGFLDFLYFVLIVGLTIVLILGFNFKAEGALLALAFSNIVFFLYTVYRISGEIDFGIRKEPLQIVLKYSLPIVPHNLSSWAMNLSDRLILNSLATLSVVAIFDIGAQLGKLINIVTLGVNSAYSPWFFEQVKTNTNHKQLIVDVTGKIVLAYIVFGIGISWFSPEFLVLISKTDYHSAYTVVPFVAFAFVANGFYYSFSNVFFLEKTKHLPLITISGAAINIAFNFALIPSYGIIGAAMACLISKIVFVVIAYIFSQRLVYIPYKTKQITVQFLFGLAIALAPLWLQDFLMARISFYLTLAIKAMLFLILCAALFWSSRRMVLDYLYRRLR